MTAELRLAHLTDPHLGPLPWPRAAELASKRITGFLSWQLRRRRAHQARVLEAVTASLRRAGPDHWVVTGDLVNIALPGEFARSVRWLEGLAPPDRLTLIPGNHDAYVAGAAEVHWAAWAPWMAGVREPVGFPFVRRVGPLALVGLSSAVPRPWGDAAGELGTGQLARLAGRLAELGRAGLARVVLVHHPPVAGWSPARKALLDAAGLRHLLRAEGAELVLAGHDHRLEVGALEGPRGPIPVLAGPSASLAAHEPERRGGGLLFRLRRESDGSWRIAAEAHRFDPVRASILVEPVPLPATPATALA